MFDLSTPRHVREACVRLWRTSARVEQATAAIIRGVKRTRVTSDAILASDCGASNANVCGSGVLRYNVIVTATSAGAGSSRPLRPPKSIALRLARAKRSMHAKRMLPSAIDLAVSTEPIDIAIASGMAGVRFNGALIDVRSDRYNWVSQGDPRRDGDGGRRAVDG